MIQRIQTLWLFLAAMLNALLFICPLYKYIYPDQALSPWVIEGVRSYIPLFLVAAVISILPLVSIFFYGNRKRQKGMVWISIISIFAFLGIVLMRVGALKNGTPPISNLQYLLPGMLVTIAALVFLILAMSGIRKDDKIIKSMDRLR